MGQRKARARGPAPGPLVNLAWSGPVWEIEVGEAGAQEASSRAATATPSAMTGTVRRANDNPISSPVSFSLSRRSLSRGQ